MKEVPSHPLGPLPWSLASSDGSLRKTNKSSLAKELQKNSKVAEVIPQPSATIIDGMALVQRLKGDHKTFSEVAESLFSMVMREGAGSKRIDVVFDVYKNESIKYSEKQKRNSDSSIEYRNIRPDHKIQQWRQFLSNSNNKNSLTVFLANEWKKEGFRHKLSDKKLFVTAGEECHQISREGDVAVMDLRSTHEEADTRLLLHAAHVARAGYKAIVISSEDTDVFILCLAFKCFITAPLLLKCGTQTRAKYIDITSVVTMLGTDVCQSLIGLHAYTGCDTVSAFAGKGKLGALKIVKISRQHQETFKLLGTEWEFDNELFLNLQ